MSSKNLLQQAYLDNVRYNQIGGQLDGISPEVAADLGFTTFEDTLRLSAEQHAAELTPQQQKVGARVGPIMCGDCGNIIPCEHADRTSSGRGYTKGF